MTDQSVLDDGRLTLDGRRDERYALVQYKPSMTPHLVTTTPEGGPRGRCATDAEIAFGKALRAREAQRDRYRVALDRIANAAELQLGFVAMRQIASDALDEGDR